VGSVGGVEWLGRWAGGRAGGVTKIECVCPAAGWKKGKVAGGSSTKQGLIQTGGDQPS